MRSSTAARLPSRIASGVTCSESKNRYAALVAAQLPHAPGIDSVGAAASALINNPSRRVSRASLKFT